MHNNRRTISGRSGSADYSLLLPLPLLEGRTCPGRDHCEVARLGEGASLQHARPGGDLLVFISTALVVGCHWHGSFGVGCAHSVGHSAAHLH